MKPKQSKNENSKSTLKTNKAIPKQKSVKKTQAEFIKGQPIWQFFDINNHEAQIKNTDGWYFYFASIK